ncbi:MAG: hypothetical protein HFF56_05885 [Lawsonibacter sp.]|nr:hypothetical protein [Lawsonibacter sp.]
MGIFDRFKKQDPAPETSSAPETECKPFGPNVLEIAKLISSGDEAVLNDVSACIENPADWYDACREQLFIRSVPPDESLEMVQWLTLIDILEKYGWVCKPDQKDKRTDFLHLVENLHGFQAQGLSVDPAWLDADGNIPAWCRALAEKWASKGVRMASIDIDSYVLFPCPVSQLPTLQSLAEEIGQYIGFVE